MESKVRAVLSGLGASAALGAFLVGVPVCLVTLVGNPLPATLPAWSSVAAAVEDGALPADALRSVLAVAVWIWWSQVALSCAAEAWAACRGRTARSLPLRAFGMQPIVVRLVAIVVAAAGSVGALAQPVLAATPSFAEIAVPMEAAPAAGEPSGAKRSPQHRPTGRNVPLPLRDCRRHRSWGCRRSRRERWNRLLLPRSWDSPGGRKRAGSSPGPLRPSRAQYRRAGIRWWPTGRSRRPTRPPRRDSTNPAGSS